MSVRSIILLGREPIHGAWAWFDELGNLQAASFLLVVLISMLGIAGGLLGATMMLAPAPLPALLPPVAAERIAPVGFEAERSEPLLPRTTMLVSTRSEPPPPRSATLLSTVNLRAEPTTASQSLVVLPADTDLVLLGDTAQTGNALWQHVRTEDEREGWIIATAIS